MLQHLAIGGGCVCVCVGGGGMYTYIISIVFPWMQICWTPPTYIDCSWWRVSNAERPPFWVHEHMPTTALSWHAACVVCAGFGTFSQQHTHDTLPVQSVLNSARSHNSTLMTRCLCSLCWIWHVLSSVLGSAELGVLTCGERKTKYVCVKSFSCWLQDGQQ